MLCPARVLIFKDQATCGPTTMRNSRDRVEVQVDDGIREETEHEHGDNEDAKGETELRGRAADPATPRQSLQLIPVSASGTLVVVPLLGWISHAPCAEALFVYVFLTAFAFAWAQHAAAVFGFVGHAWLGL